MGSIPLINSWAPLNPLYESIPSILVTDWLQGMSEEELLRTKVKTTSRKVLLFPYWADKINCLRRSLGVEV